MGTKEVCAAQHTPDQGPPVALGLATEPWPTLKALHESIPTLFNCVVIAGYCGNPR